MPTLRFMDERKPLGTDLDASEVEDFKTWARSEQQMVIGRAADTALHLLRVLPVRLRDFAVAGKWDLVVSVLDEADRLAAQRREDAASALESAGEKSDATQVDSRRGRRSG